MVKYLIFILLLPAAFADCTPYWICDDWSGCELGFMTRNCRDLAECENVNGIPVETKRCDDPDDYEIVYEDAAVAETDIETPEHIEFIETSSDETEEMVAEKEAEQVNNTQKANFYIGLLIILGFVILGVLVGRMLRNQ